MTTALLAQILTHLHWLPSLLSVSYGHTECVWRHNPGGPDNTLYICHTYSGLLYPLK
jgi:hypothetical protein